MSERTALRHWDPLSLTAVVWAKQLISARGLTAPPPAYLWQQASSDDHLARAALSHHRLIPPAAAWISSGSDVFVSDSIRDWLLAQRTRNRRQIVAHVAVAARIRGALDEREIRALFIKGPFQAKQATGDSAGRESGDLDVLVDPKDMDKALQTLVAVGAVVMDDSAGGSLARKTSQVHHATNLQWSGVSIDLHYRLDPNPDRMSIPFRELWSSRDHVQIAGTQFPTLSPADACLLVASHGSRDNWLQIRQIVDFAHCLESSRNNHCDISDLEMKATQVGVSRRLAIALAVTRLVVPEIPPQPQPAAQLAEWTASRYRKGRAHTSTRTPRNAASVFLYSMLTEDSLADFAFSVRRLVWFTSTNVEPLFPNQPLWAYPLLAPLNVARRMFTQVHSGRDRIEGKPSGAETAVRAQILCAIAMETHPRGAEDAWAAWRSRVPDLDHVTPTEMSLLPSAWTVLRKAGGSDPDAGRLTGLERRSSIHAATVIAESARIQSTLASCGIRSELTGVAAAALAYPKSSRWPLLRAELWISEADRNKAMAPDQLTRSDIIFGRHTLHGTSKPIALTWRHPDLALASLHLTSSSAVNWQGRELLVAPPHVTAMHILLRALPASAPGEGSSLIGLLDLFMLSRSPLFDREAFIYVRRKGGWNALFASHARACRSFLPPDILELLSDAAINSTSRPTPSVALGQDLFAALVPRVFRAAVRALS